MKVYPDQIQPNLTRSLPAACWLSGDEPLQMRECSDLIRSITRQQGFTERVQHDVDADFDWRQLLAEGNNMSLFSDKKIIELNLKSSKLDDNARKSLLEYLQSASPDNLLLLLSPRIEPATAKTQWFSKLEAQLMLVQVYPVDSEKLPAWISQRMKKHALTADTDAIQLLADRIEGNMLAADQEIEKLSLLFGQGTHLRNEHIARSVADNARYNVFGLIDACLAGQSARVMKTLQRLRQEGQEVLMINAMVSKELRQLSTLKNELGRGARVDEVLQRHHIWKNRQAATRSALQRLTPARLSDLLQQARQVDLAVKGMQVTPAWVVMDNLCLELSR
ncbi:MAG: DNA polymerase III subunit delta [Pseudohongiella sp.]|nr:DNA polymerase III subunit delta [Pseudohongiella sp.]MDO9518631.1 DNA polymerase III subunit delta [Pseudohongiella sp.]MDP2128405.1 DNA polymerase III subunit delta [Pseudohongiella sp.]